MPRLSSDHHSGDGLKYTIEGLKDVDELKAVYQDKIQAQKKKALDTGPQPASPSFISSDPSPRTIQEQEASTQPANVAAPPSHSSSTPRSSNSPAVKPLSAYVDVSKILSLPEKEIELIWRLRHAANPQSLCATVAYPTYSRIEATARRHPQFILPLPREGQGAEIHFLQWVFPTPDTSTVLFTHLAEFKLRGEYAQPHTTITHHLDISGQKGLVLLQGSVVEGRGVTVDEGRWLLMCLQKFYAAERLEEEEARRNGSGGRMRLLEQFSQGDGGFKVEELLEEAEKIV